MAYVKAAERHEQIVAAAIRVLSKVGVPGTTLRAVAAEAGIPLGTLHYVFPSREPSRPCPPSWCATYPCPGQRDSPRAACGLNTPLE